MARWPAARAEAVLGKGLSPIWSSITSLPAALRRLATASTSKAVSGCRPRANALSVGPADDCGAVMGVSQGGGAPDRSRALGYDTTSQTFSRERSERPGAPLAPLAAKPKPSIPALLFRRDHLGEG